MTQHPNIDLISKVDITDLDQCADIIDPDIVWRFFNPELPQLNGDHHGFEAMKGFFSTMAKTTDGTFKVNPIRAIAIGDELVVTQTRNSLTLNGADIEVDVALVWRIVKGRVKEVWDIPAIYTADGAPEQ